MVAEYDLGLNDNNRAARGSGKGYLNAGVNWSPIKHLSIDFFLKDILENGKDAPQKSRELAIRYTEKF